MHNISAPNCVLQPLTFSQQFSMAAACCLSIAILWAACICLSAGLAPSHEHLLHRLLWPLQSSCADHQLLLQLRQLLILLLEQLH